MLRDFVLALATHGHRLYLKILIFKVSMCYSLCVLVYFYGSQEVKRHCLLSGLLLCPRYGSRSITRASASILRKHYVVSPFFGSRSLGWPFFLWYDSPCFLLISSLRRHWCTTGSTLWFLSIIGLTTPRREPHALLPTVKTKDKKNHGVGVCVWKDLNNA
jgi:hypothetical protein